MIERPYYKNRLSFILGLLLVLIDTNAFAGLFSVADELIPPSSVQQRNFKDILSDNILYSRVIKDLASDVAKDGRSVSIAQALKLDIFKFTTESLQISWDRSDIVNYLSQLISKKCGPQISCEIAFNLSTSQIGGFVDEIADSILKGADNSSLLLNKQRTSLEKDLQALPPDHPDRLRIASQIEGLAAKQTEVERLRNIANKLSKKQSTPSGLICR